MSNSENIIIPAKSRYHALMKASLLAIGADILLITLKYTLSRFTGSAVLLADAWHSGGDLAVSATVLVSIVVNNRYKDNRWAKHAEGLVALLISIVLFIGGTKLILKVFVNPIYAFQLKAGIPLIIAIAGIGIAAAIAFKMFIFKQKVGKKYDSVAFSAESMHTYSDFFTTLGVWLTLVCGFFGIQFERWMTLIVGLVVIRISFKLFLTSARFFGISFTPAKTLRRRTPASFENTVDSLILKTNAFFTIAQKLQSRLFFIRSETITAYEGRIVKFQAGFLLTLYALTGFYTILPYQTGVELLLGRVIELTPPGFHYRAPVPFGKVNKVDTGVTARVESGYRTVWNFSGTEPQAYLWEYSHNQGRYIKVRDEAIAITGDENLIDVNFLCYYQITDPVKYALEVDNPHEMLRNLLCHEVHAVIGNFRLDSVLTTGRGGIQERIRNKLKKRLQEMDLGVRILDILMMEAHPPLEVVPQYRAVASARETKDRIIHQATAYANDLLPKTIGRTKAIYLNAEAYRSAKIAFSRGESSSFLSRVKYFNKYKSTETVRLRWSALEKTLGSKKIYILPVESQRRIITSKNALERGEE